jgi:hypothetical protein
MKVQTRDLQPGDVLTGGEIILARPYPETNPREGRNKMRVTLQMPKGSKYDVETRTWGKFTAIGVVNRAAWPQTRVEDLVLENKYIILHRGEDVVYIYRGRDGGARPVFVSEKGVYCFSKNFQTIPVKPVL